MIPHRKAAAAAARTIRRLAAAPDDAVLLSSSTPVFTGALRWIWFYTIPSTTRSTVQLAACWVPRFGEWGPVQVCAGGGECFYDSSAFMNSA
jgi:hypothetical protein